MRSFKEVNESDDDVPVIDEVDAAWRQALAAGGCKPSPAAPIRVQSSPRPRRRVRLPSHLAAPAASVAATLGGPSLEGPCRTSS